MDIIEIKTKKAKVYVLDDIACYRYQYRAEFFYITKKKKVRVYVNKLAQEHPIKLSLLKNAAGVRKWRGI